MTLLDTNILLRLAKPTDAAHPTTIAAISALQAAGDVLCIVPQNLYEFWAVATRPQAANGLGQPSALCRQISSAMQAAFRFLDDRPTLFHEWESLVAAYQCHGRISFDARLVAAMQTHGIQRLLTYNVADFARFRGIIALDPSNVIAAAVNPASTL